MANKDFVVKNGLTVASGGVTIGSTERISSAGLITGVVNTQAEGTDSMAIASTAFVQQELASLVDSAPSTLNTLNELAAALGDDASFSTTVTNSIAAKLPLAGGTLTGALIVTDGSTSAPSIGNSGDTNSGIYFPADDQMGLVVGGSRKLLANSDGITINNGDLTIPSKIIHDGDTDTYLRFSGADDFRIVVGNSTRAAFNTSKIHFNQEGINQDFQVEGQGTGNEGLIYADASTNRVGIGTTTPAAHLDVTSASSPTLQLKDTTNNVTLKAYAQDANAHVATTSDHPLIFDVNNTEAFRIDTSGRLLIGTTSTTPAFSSGNGHAFHVSDMSHISRDDGTALAINRGGGHGTVLNLRSGGNSVGNFATSSTGIYVDTNFGIGTTSPAAKLHISGNSDTSDEDCMLIIDDVDGSAGSRIPAIMFRSNTGGSVTNQARIRGTDTQGIVMSGSSALGDDLVVQAGKVGIGTTSPDTMLHLYKSTGSGALEPEIKIENVHNTSSTTDGAGRITFYSDDSNNSGIPDNSWLGQIRFMGDDKDGSATEFEYAYIVGAAHDPGSGTSRSGRLDFYNRMGNSMYKMATLRKIQSSGSTGALGINETNPAYTLDVNTTGESNALRIYQGSSNKDASMVIQNAGTDSGSDTLMQLYTAAGAGDPMVRWAISGNETYSMGIDNSDNDNLAITNGSTMGNNTRWKMDAAGRITTPNQPIYGGGRNAGHISNNQVYVADNAHTNVGSHYNTSNGKFTAPVAGNYFLFGNIITHDSGSSDTYVWWAIRKNGSILKYFYDDAEPGRHQQICGTMVITLAASDYVEWYVGNSSNQWYGSQHEYANIGCFLIG